MEELQIFNNPDFGNIRATIINNEPFFVGKDVAEVLGYSNSRKALSDHVDQEDKGVTICDTLGGKQEMTVINESGVYASMNTEVTNNEEKLIWAMAIIMIPLVIDAIIRLIQLGRMIG